MKLFSHINTHTHRPIISVQFLCLLYPISFVGSTNFPISSRDKNGYGDGILTLKLHLSSIVSTECINNNFSMPWASLYCQVFSTFDHLQRPAAETGCKMAGEGPFCGSRIKTLFLMLCRRGTVAYFSSDLWRLSIISHCTNLFIHSNNVNQGT